MAEPETPAETSKEPRKGRGSEGEVVEIELEMSRQRLIAWTVFGTIVGLLLIFKLGTVGVWVGFVLVLLGVFRAWQLIQSFVYPPGTIVVTANEVSLPRGLCLPRPIKVQPSAVTAAYFLRRSVPWNRSAPVLVVELGQSAMAFPRDWFASEADQRHVIHALLRRRDGASESISGGEEPVKRERVDIETGWRSPWLEMGAGAVLAITGFVVYQFQPDLEHSQGGIVFLVLTLSMGAGLIWRGFKRR